MAIKHNNSVPSDTSDFQEFYATNDIIQSSTQALAASGSAFAVAQGASTITGKAPGIKNAPLKTLYKVEVFNQDLARQGKGNYTFNVCTGNLSNFLGILRTMPDDPDRLEQRRQAVLKLQGVLDEENQTVNLDEATGEAMYEARKLVTGKNEGAKQAYDKLNDSMRKLISQQYGINENALPDVGEGFGVLQGGKGGRAGYGHFAPVIARSGEDRVTLENDVSQESGREKTRVMGQ